MVQYQWEIFIFIEVISLLSILLFGVVRYFFLKQKFSLMFLLLFVLLLVLEAVLAFLIYRETGEMSTFQIVITVFLVYACTFGISDFKKLDRWMRSKIGNFRGVDLLTEQDKYEMEKQKNPKYIAKKYRISSIIHLLLFLFVQIIFLSYSLNHFDQVQYYLTDLSWIGTEHVEETPYANDSMYRISMIWGLIFIVDFIYSWSYTVFPSK